MSVTLQSSRNVAHTAESNQRSARHAREFWRLAEAMRLVIPVMKSTDVLGEDDVVANLASHYGFGLFDFVAMKIRHEGGSAVVIGVPTRVWHHHRSKTRLLLLKKDLKRAACRCILVAERVFRRQPRLRNLQLLDAASEAVASPTDQLGILQAVLENGGAPILDCASLIDGPRPVEGVLSLVAAGHLRIDLSHAIGPMSMVSLPSSEVAQ